MTSARIKIIDSPMGKGKTHFAIQTINQMEPDKKIIYITPFLKEVTRVKDACPNAHFFEPNRKTGYGSKMRSLIKLVARGENIVATHSLFSNITDELIAALSAHDYVLFLDEVFETVEKYEFADPKLKWEVREEITKKDVRTMIDKNIIKIEDDYQVTWLNDNDYLNYYNRFKNLAQRNLVYYIGDNLLMWTFPIEVFGEGVFSEIYILTHMFKSQIQAYYYDYFNVKYEMFEVYRNGNDNLLRPYNSLSNREWVSEIRDKIEIEQNSKLNKVGNAYLDSRNHPWKSALSSTWYEKNKELLPIIKNNISNYFRSIPTNADERMWTCFKSEKNILRNDRASTKNWVALNARATNDYTNKSTLAYMVNRYLDGSYENFFRKRNVQIDEDQYALSEMLQWIWRSRIRRYEKINIYIPSERMRNLLENFLYQQ